MTNSNHEMIGQYEPAEWMVLEGGGGGGILLLKGGQQCWTLNPTPKKTS